MVEVVPEDERQGVQLARGIAEVICRVCRKPRKALRDHHVVREGHAEIEVESL